MKQPDFIHLHIHSAYSLLEGALPLDKLLDLAIADDQPAIGIADSSNLFGALEFSQKAVAKGIQPLIGCEIKVDFNEDVEFKNKLGFSKNTIVLMAKNKQGFSNLSHLVSKAYLQGHNEQVAISIDWLKGENSRGLICLSSGAEGCIDPLFANGLEQYGVKRLKELQEIFDNRFYIELQRHNIEKQQVTESFLLDFAYKNGVPLVATNEPFFPSKKDFQAHDALLAISEGAVLTQSQRRKLSDQHYYKTQKQMEQLFQDIPEALDNSIEIAKRISFFPQTHAPILPKFAAAKNVADDMAVAAEADELSKQAKKGLKERLETIDLAENCNLKDYQDRLEFELKVIADMKYPGYFLIVADFIKWAKNQNIPVGPGRGSGAGSLVAYALTITDLDPLRYNLLFERFLNPDRISMPDFDIDFCQDRREEVIKYVQGKYGKSQVAQIITFGSLQARAALRDVGRVMQMPYPQVDRICKLVPSNPADPMKLAEAIRFEPKLQAMRNEDETVANLLEIAQDLEGLYRHASTHAAGIVIADRPIEELVPLYRDPRSQMPVTQYSQKWVEAAGLVKFDFLGLKTLTIIDNAVAMINENGNKDFSIENIPIDDKKTYSLYQMAETTGVFQVESQGMRRVLIDLKPDRFEDIIALVALYRPGPMDNIGSFCKRKHGEEDSTTLHPDMDAILSETYGIIVYQEQVMQIAQKLSGYSLGEADILRRAMGKKDKKEMDKQRSRFIEGATDKDIKSGKATKIFELLAKFANYGFNKSHAAAYALVSYQTAYLKAHYPHEFLASSMSLDMGNSDKLYDYKRDADRLKIEIVPPSINSSNIEFSVKNNKIHYSLCAIKGIGKQVIEHIEDVRKEKKFADLTDLSARINPKILNKRTLEILINAGAFDELEPRRELSFACVDIILATAQRKTSDIAQGITDLFATESFANDKPEPISFQKDIDAWSEEEKLRREFGVIGFYLSGHPLDQYETLLERLKVQKYVEFEQSINEGKSAGRVAGVVTSRFDRKTRKGKDMANIILSDSSGGFEAVVFSENLQKYGALLQLGKYVILNVEAEQRPDGISLRLLSAQAIEEQAQKNNKNMVVFLQDAQCLNSIKQQLDSFGEGSGEVSFIIIRQDSDVEYEVSLNKNYKLSSSLASGIKSLNGVLDVQLN